MQVSFHLSRTSLSSSVCSLTQMKTWILRTQDAKSLALGSLGLVGHSSLVPCLDRDHMVSTPYLLEVTHHGAPLGVELRRQELYHLE